MEILQNGYYGYYGYYSRLLLRYIYHQRVHVKYTNLKRVQELYVVKLYVYISICISEGKIYNFIPWI